MLERRTAIYVVAAVIALVPKPSFADDHPVASSSESSDVPRGPRAGFAFGIAMIPVGPSEHMTLAPIAIDVGARLNDALEVAGIAELAPSIGGDCRVAAPGMLGLTVGSCEGWRTRLGVRARVHLAPSWAIDPWVGTGFALDVLYAPGFTENTSPRPFFGFSLPHAEIGFDVRLARGLTIAPFASADFVVWVATLGGPAPPHWATETPQYALATGARAAYTF